MQFIYKPMQNTIVQPSFCETCKLSNLRIRTGKSRKKVGVSEEDIQVKKKNEVFQTEWSVNHASSPSLPPA